MASLARYRSDPEYRAKVLAKQKHRYTTDSEYRARKQKYNSESRKQRYATDPVYREQMAQLQRDKLKNPAIRARYRALARSYRTGFTPELVAALRDVQGGSCALCGVKMVTTGPNCRTREHADHCHRTGQPRGLLCLRCNRDLGAYERMKTMSVDSYLAHPPAETVFLRRPQTETEGT